MRTSLSIIAGLAGGFILGIAISSFIGVIGMYVFHDPIGIKYLPFYTAVIGAVLVPIIDQKNQKPREI
jgi:TRAP-type C4-dicarboxylate transport system permease small subunit